MTAIEAAREIIIDRHSLPEGEEIYIQEVRPNGMTVQGFDYVVKNRVAGFVTIDEALDRTLEN